MSILAKILHPSDVNKYASPGKTTLSVFAPAKVVVNRDSALKLGAVWRGVNIIGDNVGKTPLHLYCHGDDGSIYRAYDDYRFRILWREPARGVSAKRFFKTLMGHVLLSGNAYAYISRNPDYTIDELWLLNPDTVQVVRKNGAHYYLVQVDDSTAAKIPYYDMIHIAGLGFDGIRGYSFIRYFGASAGLAQSMDDYSSEFFANGSISSMVVYPKQTISSDEFQEFKKSWREAFSGIGNRHKTAVSPTEIGVVPININARDAQLIESKEFSIRDIANWLGIPPHKLGDNSRTAYNSIEAENMSFLSESLDSWFVEIEQELYIKLLTEAEKASGRYFFEFNRAALVRADITTRYNALSKAIGGAAFMTINEARRIENLNPIEGGDKLLLPLNMNTATVDVNDE